jgi:membrane fusion protein (multidrug efflux system)
MSYTNNQRYTGRLLSMIGLLGILIAAESCTTSSGNTDGQMPLPMLPVLTLNNLPATTYREFPATVEGKVNVEIRPQVDGYLEQIFADEGAYVKAGAPLFRVSDKPYREQLANANAALLAAKGNLDKAELEVERLTPLVQNNVVSEVQMKTAKSGLQTAKASVAQAEAMVSNAQINVGYTLVKAPVSGYIGRIPHKTGSLVGRGEAQPLTVLSDIHEVYAYFSMSETDFLQFKEEATGNTIEEKIGNLPPVELVLADDSVYPEKGRIETVDGQFDKTMGAITFRAVFPNSKGLLRSGNTGRIRILKQYKEALVVPQEATFEMQDKVLVFVVADSNKVVSRPIAIADQSRNYYFVKDGLKAGDRIVYTGLTRLRDGVTIAPQVISMDSLIKSKPL